MPPAMAKNAVSPASGVHGRSLRLTDEIEQSQPHNPLCARFLMAQFRAAMLNSIGVAFTTSVSTRVWWTGPAATGSSGLQSSLTGWDRLRRRQEYA